MLFLSLLPVRLIV